MFLNIQGLPYLTILWKVIQPEGVLHLLFYTSGYLFSPFEYICMKLYLMYPATYNMKFSHQEYNHDAR